MVPAQELSLTPPDRISSALSSEQGPGWAGGWLGPARHSDHCHQHPAGRGPTQGSPADRLQPSGWSESQERDRGALLLWLLPTPGQKWAGEQRGAWFVSSTPTPVSILRPNYCGSPRRLESDMSPGLESQGERPEQRHCLGPFESTLWTSLKVWPVHPTETCPWADLCSFALEQHPGCPAANAGDPPLTAHPLSKLVSPAPVRN